MKFHREKIAALVALGILLIAISNMALGLASPGRTVTLELFLPDTSRELIPRRWRTFTEKAVSLRDPFSFSEGWQGMEAVPLALPPPGVAPWLVPSPVAGPRAEEWGFRYEAKPPEGAGGEATP